jgi:uncharacterized membrane protein
MDEPHLLERVGALAIAAASAAAMLYVGLYQSRIVDGMWCPLNGQGCEIVADAPFARPYGIPDGYIGAGLYGLMLAFVWIAPGRSWAWTTLVVLAVLATYANIKGVVDMAKLGAFCTYCLFTTVASPLLLWLAWRLR